MTRLKFSFALSLAVATVATLSAQTTPQTTPPVSAGNHTLPTVTCDKATIPYGGSTACRASSPLIVNGAPTRAVPIAIYVPKQFGSVDANGIYTAPATGTTVLHTTFEVVYKAPGTAISETVVDLGGVTVVPPATDFVASAAVSQCGGGSALFVYRATTRELAKFTSGPSPIFLGSVTMTELAVGAQAKVVAFQSGPLACTVAIGAADQGDARSYDLAFTDGLEMTLRSTVKLPPDVRFLAADDLDQDVLVGIKSSTRRGNDFLLISPASGTVTSLKTGNLAPAQ